MDYTEIVDMALSYSDREDAEVADRMDRFLRIVEARVNRKLRVSGMSIRATVPLIDGDSYYGLPPDFGGLRDIEISSSPDANNKTLFYMSPEQLNNHSNSGGQGSKIYYTIVAQQIQISPAQSMGIMEVIYYQKLIPLTSIEPVNWLSGINPDAYIFGLLVEISAFAKDKDAATLWNGRFVEVLDEIDNEDKTDRWSGTSLEIRVG